MVNIAGRDKKRRCRDTRYDEESRNDRYVEETYRCKISNVFYVRTVIVKRR